jgi:microcystin-dependent protein
MDDRTWMDLAAAVTALQRELDEMRKTTLTRLNAAMTGDIEPTIRTTPKKGTLLLNGAAYWRDDYPNLWQWATDNALVTGGLFGNGDGSTTFTVPNFKGRVPIGVGTLGSNTYTIGQMDGSATRTLVEANMPQHTHNIDWAGHVHTTFSGDSHAHNIGDSTHGHTHWSAGAHFGHFNSSSVLVNAGTAIGVAPFNPGTTTLYNHHFHDIETASHNHTGAVGGNFHSHGNTSNSKISEEPRGSGTAFDNRMPSIAVNWLIWY